MPSPAPSPIPTPEADSACRCGDRAAWRDQALRALAEVGVNLARSLEREAEEAPADAGTTRQRRTEFALAYSRIARAVRLTVALSARLEEDRRTRTARAEAKAVDGRQNASLRGAIRKVEVQGIIEQVIEDEPRERGDGRDDERLFDDLADRLNACPDIDFAYAPIGELVAQVCRDLGVAFDPDDWDDEDWSTPWPDPRAEGGGVNCGSGRGPPNLPSPLVGEGGRAEPGRMRGRTDLAAASLIGGI